MHQQVTHTHLPIPDGTLESPLAWAESVHVQNPTANAPASLDTLELAPPGYDAQTSRPPINSARLDALELAPPAIEKPNGRASGA